MTSPMHPLATAWLDRVELLSRGLPPDRRAELLLDLREHVQAALPPGASPAQVEAVVARLGDPGDVVAAAWDGTPDAHARESATTSTDQPGPNAVPNGWEASALSALVLAGLVLTVFGMLWGIWFAGLLYGVPLWLFGMVVLVGKTRWNAQERLLAMLVPLVFLVATFMLLLTPADSPGEPKAIIALAGPPIVGLVIVVWLVRRLRSRILRRDGTRHASPRPTTDTSFGTEQP